MASHDHVSEKVHHMLIGNFRSIAKFIIKKELANYFLF